MFMTALLNHFCGASQKITLEDLSESKSAMDEKSTRSIDPSHSVNSLQTETHESTNVAIYEVGKTLQRNITHILIQ